ncbi:MAG: pyridoxamine 5'-phosphate oxidase [Rickettsiales bacterium]|jgi:pyridoxamine 5'-phosphate oxidase|nr:pyridoxamine 5'-phosphate oxidase [Rickettsiales bacterium]
MKIENPFLLFTEWFKQAEKHPDIKQANAVNLATSTRHGFPSSRMVLIKNYSEEGFVFYTNLESRKGLELKDNPRVALCFYWEALDKQIRIEGNVKPVSKEEADQYFDSRPLDSRLGAWASKQSRPMAGGLDVLKNAALHSLDNKMGAVERPPFWSGFRVIPTRVEFWEDGGTTRLHDRTLFLRQDTNSDWKSQKLYP